MIFFSHKSTFSSPPFPKATVPRSSPTEHFRRFVWVGSGRTAGYRRTPFSDAAPRPPAICAGRGDSWGAYPDTAATRTAQSHTFAALPSVSAVHAQGPPPRKGSSSAGKIVPMGNAVSVSYGSSHCWLDVGFHQFHKQKGIVILRSSQRQLMFKGSFKTCL